MGVGLSTSIAMEICSESGAVKGSATTVRSDGLATRSLALPLLLYFQEFPLETSLPRVRYHHCCGAGFTSNVPGTVAGLLAVKGCFPPVVVSRPRSFSRSPLLRQ